MFFKVDLEAKLGSATARVRFEFSRQHRLLDGKLASVNLDPAELEILLHIYEAERRWADGGHDSRSFLLLHLGGMRRVLDHPGWEESWDVPDSQAIDDLDEYGLLRVELPDGLNRSFVLSAAGRSTARAASAVPRNPDSTANRPQDGSTPLVGTPTAIVVWAHEDPLWQKTVLDLVLELRANGVAADVDLFHLHDSTIEWSTYGPRAIETSDFVLIAVSAAWKRRFDGTNMPTRGAGAAAEADAILGLFDQSNQADFRRKVKALVLPGASADDIPLQLRGSLQRFDIPTVNRDGLEDLLRTIHGRPAFPIPSVGAVPLLPPEFRVEPSSATAPEGLTEKAGDIRRPASILPAIHSSTTALLRHLQTHGAQTERELEQALGDVDQIGSDEIAEWALWACENGMVERSVGGSMHPTWSIAAAGQRLIGPA